MNEQKGGRSGRLQLLLIAAVFIGPLLVAAWLYFQGDDMQPAGRTNHGALLEPIVNLDETLPDSPLHAHNEQTWLILYSQQGACEESCRAALYTTRQARLMLGRERDRLQRVLLHGDGPPDTVFLQAEHDDLVAITDSGLGTLLNNKRPAGLPADGYYLVDPLGNLVMYFRPDLDPADMVDDIKRLLKLSRIG